MRAKQLTCSQLSRPREAKNKIKQKIDHLWLKWVYYYYYYYYYFYFFLTLGRYIPEGV